MKPALLFNHLAALVLASGLATSVAAAPLIVSKISSDKAAFDDLTIAAANHGYQVVKLQPIDSALVKRGFDNPHVRLLFIGSAQAVRDAEEQAPLLVQLLPLRIVMIARKNEITLMSDDFAPWRSIFSDTWSAKLLTHWEDDLKAILSDYAESPSTKTPIAAP